MKGVNDDPKTLAQLMRGLLRFGINPYYVFQCRPVKRVKQNFQLPLMEACKVVDEARTLVDGHGKRFKFVMSHESGKIEIIGIMGDDIYFKQHQARNPADIGAFFKRKLHPEAGWLDDLES
jgi:lysine 2,3-aminomutase